jgi:hypothetical protein
VAKVKVPDVARFTPLRVEWNDAVTETEVWFDEDDINTKVHGVVSAGLYIDHSEVGGLALALCYDSEFKTINQAVTIPLVAISKIDVLMPVNA